MHTKKVSVKQISPDIRANTVFGLYSKATSISPLRSVQVSLPSVHTFGYKSVRVHSVSSFNCEEGILIGLSLSVNSTFKASFRAVYIFCNYCSLATSATPWSLVCLRGSWVQVHELSQGLLQVTATLSCSALGVVILLILLVVLMKLNRDWTIFCYMPVSLSHQAHLGMTSLFDPMNHISTFRFNIKKKPMHFGRNAFMCFGRFSQ